MLLRSFPNSALRRRKRAVDVIAVQFIHVPPFLCPQYILSVHPSTLDLLNTKTLDLSPFKEHIQARCLTRTQILAIRPPTRMVCLPPHPTMANACNRYKAKNQDEPGVEEKIQDLTSFISKSKFGMMTTSAAGSGVLASRCMALAATVSRFSITHITGLTLFRRTVASTSSSTPTQNPARPMTLRKTLLSTCPSTMPLVNGHQYLVMLKSMRIGKQSTSTILKS